MLSEGLPERVIGDKAYDSDRLDEEFATMGIEMIAPHRSNRLAENATQDGRPLRRYKRRWTVERTIGWLQNFRRLCIRWEKSTRLFQGFLHTSCAIILLKGVLRWVLAQCRLRLGQNQVLGDATGTWNSASIPVQGVGTAPFRRILFDIASIGERYSP